MFAGLRQTCGTLWSVLRQLAMLLMLARVPILIVAAGIALVSYVAQISELFDISLGHWPWAAWTLTFALGLALLVWYSARTLYSFNWPARCENRALAHLMGEVLPRLLGTLVLLAIALAYFNARSPARDGSHLYWTLAAVLLASAFLAFTFLRRPLSRRLLPELSDRMGLDSEPRVGELEHWRELGWTRWLHVVGMVALPVSWLVGYYAPQLLQPFGPLALILGAAAFGVAASTWPIYASARARFPLLLGLLLLASLVTWSGWNDNHAVRLSADQDSHQDPATQLRYSAAERQTLAEFMSSWWNDARKERCSGRAWMVSSEGGGIRAAMWTVLVLAELDRQTGGRFWECTLAASGVSGGSLGLAVYASHRLDDGGDVDENALVRVLEADYLAPVLGSLFGTDAFQRFLPWRAFSDRGQALEDAWRRAYACRHVPEGASCDAQTQARDGRFGGPLAALARPNPADAPLPPALFLNTTIAATGERLIQHPFARIAGGMGFSFPGSVDGAEWLPAELPVFSAAHNSARFTLISPAGTVYRRTQDAMLNATGDPVRLGQVVDGGYFENSGATVIEAMVRQFREIAGADSGLRVVHISNDPAVASFAGSHDNCDLLDPPPEPDTEPVEGSEPPRYMGELRAPLIALMATRTARGAYARQALLEAVNPSDSLRIAVEELRGGKGTVEVRRSRLWHFRLCKGERRIPLGWTLSRESTCEMARQLRAYGPGGRAEQVIDRIRRDLGLGDPQPLQVPDWRSSCEMPHAGM
jgi:hypothetical protein